MSFLDCLKSSLGWVGLGFLPIVVSLQTHIDSELGCDKFSQFKSKVPPQSPEGPPNYYLMMQLYYSNETDGVYSIVITSDDCYYI